MLAPKKQFRVTREKSQKVITANEQLAKIGIASLEEKERLKKIKDDQIYSETQKRKAENEAIEAYKVADNAKKNRSEQLEELSIVAASLLRIKEEIKTEQGILSSLRESNKKDKDELETRRIEIQTERADIESGYTAFVNRIARDIGMFEVSVNQKRVTTENIKKGLDDEINKLQNHKTALNGQIVKMQEKLQTATDSEESLRKESNDLVESIKILEEKKVKIIEYINNHGIEKEKFEKEIADKEKELSELKADLKLKASGIAKILEKQTELSTEKYKVKQILHILGVHEKEIV